MPRLGNDLSHPTVDHVQSRLIYFYEMTLTETLTLIEYGRVLIRLILDEHDTSNVVQESRDEILLELNALARSLAATAVSKQ